MRLRQNAGHIAHIEMPDIGSKERIKLHAMWQVISSERPSIYWIVRLASELELIDKLAD